MVTVAQSAANWRNTHTDVDRTHSLLTSSAQLQPRCATEAPAQPLQNLKSNCTLKTPEGGGRQTGVPGEKIPTALPADRYHVLLEEKIQRPGRESSPHPPTLEL